MTEDSSGCDLAVSERIWTCNGSVGCCASAIGGGGLTGVESRC